MTICLLASTLRRGFSVKAVAETYYSLCYFYEVISIIELHFLLIYGIIYTHMTKK